MIILHCALENKWKEALENGEYHFNSSDENKDIPCMDPSHINQENFSFPSTKDYIILCINSDKVEVNIDETSNIINIHGSIPTNAVVSTISYTFDNNDKFAINDEIKDIIIINDVLKKLDINYSSHKYFNDGTYSRIMLLNEKYVVKQNEPKLLESEVLFSKCNTDSKLQHVAYADENFKYIVYDYIPGDVMHTIDDNDDLFTNLKEIVHSFAKYDGSEFGYLYAPSASWTEFLKNLVHHYSMQLPDSFDFLPHVYDAISELERYPFEKKLIHGDLGTHNFIKNDGKFVGAIDPIPVAGDALYDLIYASISNVDLLNDVSVDFLASLSGEPKEKVKALLTVLLFNRLAICLKHHKEDFDAYVDFWYKLID